MRPQWYVTEDFAWHLPTGVKLNKPATGNWNALATAMKNASPGDRIGFRGVHNGLKIAFGSPWSVDLVKWANNQPVSDLEVYGLDSTAKIQGTIAFGNQYGLPKNLKFHSYTHVASSQAAYIANMHTGPYLGMEFEDILFECPAVNGKPLNKWIFRFHGNVQFNIKGCEQQSQNIEHFVYADNVPGDSSVQDCTAYKNGRTMVQIVNRKESGPSGFGTILLKNLTAVENGITEGASAYTCAGHQGDFIVENCSTIGSRGGALVTWFEGPNPAMTPPKLGAYLDVDGYAIQNVKITGGSFDNLSHGDRDAIMLSAARSVDVGPTDVKSNKSAIHFDHQQGKTCGSFKNTSNPKLSQHLVGHKKLIQGWDKLAFVVWTDQQIDALFQ